MKFSYTWLQTHFEKPLPSAEALYEVIGLKAFEPEGIEKANGDVVLDFDILPNRAHDCLCHRGLAREVATLFDIELRATTCLVDVTYQNPVSVTVTDTERCRRYGVRRIDGVTVGPSPDWLRQRLEAIGQRSINNVVDATNYVMFDQGQPLHAFDADKVAGEIIVRRAQEGETMTLLGGEERALSSEDLVIADEEGPLALAGIKGGTKAEVTSDTTNLILEAANFNPVTTRATSRRVKLSSDSSKRFENEITPEWTLPALEAVSHLIHEIAGANTIGTITDIYPQSLRRDNTIMLEHSTVNASLGVEVPSQMIENICNKLGLQISPSDADRWQVAIPEQRFDLEIQADLIEEIGRVYGYDEIPATLLPNSKTTPHPETLLAHRIRQWLLQKGWNEVMTYTFRNKGDVEMMNALASDKRFLRSNLADSFGESLQKNLQNAELFGSEGVSQFEIGSTFPGGNQEEHLIIGYASNKKKDTRNLEQLLAELNQELGLSLSGVPQNGVLEVRLPEHPTTQGTYQDAGITNTEDDRTYHEPSIYPFTTRDVAVWIPDDADPAALVEIFQRELGNLLVRKPRLFDTFAKDGRTSYAYRLVIQAKDRTLTDEEVGKLMGQISHRITEKSWEER